MKPVFQTRTQVPGGNCFQACVASIFELPLDDVPYFLDGAAGDSRWTPEQWNAVRSFAETNNTRATWLDPDDKADRVYIEKLEQSGLFYIATGPSPTYPQYHHCVVMQHGQYVHDPLPGLDKKFLAGAPTHYILFEPNDL